jgi:hypothetical protein
MRPPEVFQGVWNVAGVVRSEDDHAALAIRPGLS